MKRKKRPGLRTLKMYLIYWPDKERVIATFATKKAALRCRGTLESARRDGLVLVPMKGHYIYPRPAVRKEP